MPFPYAYYQDNYTGPIHATRFKANAYVSNPVAPKTTSGDIDATEQSVLTFDTSGSNIIIDSLTGIQNGQIVEVIKLTNANSLTLKNQSTSGSGTKFYSATGSDIFFAPNTMGGTWFIAIQDGATLKLCEVKLNTFGLGSTAFPSISFSEDSDTGFYRKAANQIGIVANGLDRVLISATAINSLTQHQFADGTNLAPSISFTNDTDTGFYRTVDAIGLSGDGVARFFFNKTGILDFNNPILRANSSFQFLTIAGGTAIPQSVWTGSLLASDSFATDSVNIPTNGIYSKGHIKTAGQFQGVATSAQFADLAERYEADAVYPVGTIVDIGGSKEITAAKQGSCFGIISTAPGFKMNSEAGSDETHPYVALAGRVPCRVVGFIKKGDQIVVSSPGIGCAKFLTSNSPVIGRALEDKDTQEEGLVMVVTRAVI